MAFCYNGCAMLFPIPIGYFVAVFLLVCGVLNCAEYLTDIPENHSRAALLNGLAETCWPIVVASVILLLIQINRQLEKLRLQVTAAPAPKAKKKKKTPEEDEEMVSPVPAANLAGLARPAPAQGGVQPIVRSQPSPHKQLYPNSPIPGGGRVPQQPAAPAPQADADLPPRPEPLPSTRSVKRAPSKSEAESLSFFKVD